MVELSVHNRMGAGSNPATPTKRTIGNNAYGKYNRAETSSELEMAALDEFGPKSRAAIVNAPIQILAVAILETVLNKIPNIDLKRSDVDASIAHGIQNNTYHLLLQDREPKDSRTPEERAADAKLGMWPIVPRRLRRAIR